MLAAATGVGLGVSGLLNYSAGVFAKDLEQAIGLTRTELGLAFFLSTIGLACALPVVGWLVDRYGPARPAAAGAAILALGFAALALLVGDVTGYVVTWTLIGMVAACSAPVAYSRAVAGAFDRQRGLALGLMQVGIGVSAMIVPAATTLVIAAAGWRTGYLFLAGLALAGIVPALALPGRGAPRAASMATAGAPRSTAAMRSPVFLLLLAAFGTMAVSFAGLLPHFIPLVREAGLGAVASGALAGLMGAAVIVSRIVVGWLADRVPATRIAAACCALCAMGCLALAAAGGAAAWIGAVALGLAIGSEADLISYLTARYFGLEGFGRLYSVQYAGFMLMAGLGPLWVGAVADRMGGYAVPLTVAAAGLGLAVPLFWAAERAGARHLRLHEKDPS